MTSCNRTQEDREFDRRMARYEEESKELTRWWHSNIEPYVVRAFPAEYEKWLLGHVERGGHVSHSYDYNMPSSFYVAEESFVVDRSLHGANSFQVIVPEELEVRFLDGYGHCTIYLMKDFRVQGNRWTPTYKDIEVKQ